MYARRDSRHHWTGVARDGWGNTEAQQLVQTLVQADLALGRECTLVPLRVRWCRGCKDSVDRRGTTAADDGAGPHIDVAGGRLCQRQANECTVLLVINHRRQRYGIFDPLLLQETSAGRDPSPR